MKDYKFLLFVSIFQVLLLSCGTTKGYLGNTQPQSELAVIKGESNVVTISGRKYTEQVLIAKVDSLVVGNYYKGWPKAINVEPGERLIEVRHFMPWTFSNTYNGGGAVGGAITGSSNEKSMTHYHYILKFIVEKNMNYSIKIKTLAEEKDTPLIEVVNNTTGKTIDTAVTEKIINEK
jgi:hypothetical protein